MRRTSPILRTKYESILQAREKHLHLPIATFCKQHSISLSTFYYWNKKLHKFINRYPAPDKFIPVLMNQALPADGSKPNYEVRFSNGTTLLISGALDQEKFSALLRTVAGFPS